MKKTGIKLFVLGVLICGPTWAADKPNIILIMVDDMGFSDIGCYGGEVPTPHLDALAEGSGTLTDRIDRRTIRTIGLLRW